MPTIDETANAMFSCNFQWLQEALSTIRQIKSALDCFLDNKAVTGESSVNIHNFSGQHTDIAYATADNGVSVSDINRIEDSEIRSNVMRSYSDAVNDGYLNYDKETGKFTLTDKGNEHINSAAFKEQFEKDQNRVLAENKAVVTLKGNKSDLEVFRYTDEINLNAISGNPKYNSIMGYFQKCEKYGWVDISDNGTVKATEKCADYLKTHSDKSFKVTKLTADNVKDTAANFSKQAANQASKQAVQQAAKQAAVQTAKAGTQAAAGAATAGVSVTVDAVIQLSKQGVKVLDNLTNLNKGATPKHS